MEVTMISMPKERALEELERYKSSKRARANEEHDAIRRGYEAMAEGTPLLHLTKTIANAPRDAKHRPMLAVARGDRKEVCVGWRFGSNSIIFSGTNDYWRDKADLRIRIRMGFEPSYEETEHGYAVVPIIPPDIARGHDLKKHLVLWDVVAWAKQSAFKPAPPDPMLLRRIAGDLFAVVAQWDLTPLERLILEGRNATL